MTSSEDGACLLLLGGSVVIVMAYGPRDQSSTMTAAELQLPSETWRFEQLTTVVFLGRLLTHRDAA